jgi:polyferredoxin
MQGALYDRTPCWSATIASRRAQGAAAAGDCVDCYRCVSVCPTGIDIRNGTQMECVGCANCIDACDEVMTRLDRPRGLVRYDSQRGFTTGRRRFVRVRVLLYGILLLIGVTVFALSASQRTSFEANLIRPPGAAFTVAGDRLENVLQLHLVNKLPVTATFRIEALGPAAPRSSSPSARSSSRAPAMRASGWWSCCRRRAARSAGHAAVATEGPDGPVEASASAPLVRPFRR